MRLCDLSHVASAHLMTILPFEEWLLKPLCTCIFSRYSLSVCSTLLDSVGMRTHWWSGTLSFKWEGQIKISAVAGTIKKMRGPEDMGIPSVEILISQFICVWCSNTGFFQEEFYCILEQLCYFNKKAFCNFLNLSQKGSFSFLHLFQISITQNIFNIEFSQIS
jgi:hypothetical protein